MAAALLLQHHCSTCVQGAGGCGRGHRGRASPVHHRLELSAHRNCDWNFICLVHSVDILISISYNLLGREARLAAAWLNGLCTQSNLLHLQFPVLENLSVSLSEVSIAITAILVKHWKWQPIQIVILLDSNCSSLRFWNATFWDISTATGEDWSSACVSTQLCFPCPLRNFVSCLQCVNLD